MGRSHPGRVDEFGAVFAPWLVRIILLLLESSIAIRVAPMNSSLGALGRLFSSEGSVPRRAWGSWPDWVVWEHVVGNALVGIACVALPLMIWRLWARRPGWRPSRGVVLPFALFIGLCGLGRLLDMLAFFGPTDRLSGRVLVATGLARAGPRGPCGGRGRRRWRWGAPPAGARRAGRGEGPPARRLDAADRLGRPARRPCGLLQRAVVRVHRPTREAEGDESWIPVIHPDDLPGCIDAWDHAIETGEPYRVEHRFKDHATGEYRWHVGRASPARDASGRITRWFGTATDIHEERFQAEALREAEARQRRAMSAAGWRTGNGTSRATGSSIKIPSVGSSTAPTIGRSRTSRIAWPSSPPPTTR